MAYTHDEYIEKFKQKHGDTYDYSKTKFKGATSKVTVRCKVHGNFDVQAYVHSIGGGCPDCASNKKDTQDSFIRKAKLTHGNFYSYNKVKYVNSTTKVTITCPLHGDWEQLPNGHLQGYKCSECAGNTAISKDSYVSELKSMYGDYYDYSKIEYDKRNKTVILGCPTHGFILQSKRQLRTGGGCSKCNDARSKGYSNKSILWLKQCARIYKIRNIQHAENGGEYVIPGTRIKVDGYHKRSNTIFEFHGSCWHGDPKIYSPRSKPHPHNNKTARRLYLETIEREDYLRSLGYNLVVVWESDFRS